MRVGVLVSGTGTILESLLEADIPIVVVGADRPCRAVDVAERAQVATELVDRRAFGGYGDTFDRSAFTDALVAALAPHHLDLLAMAGFGTVVGSSLHDAYPGRILNTHPALLPAFPGWHAVAEALAAGVDVTGCTVHVATIDMDSGPVLAQEQVPVRPGDTETTLHERIKEVERDLYPRTIRAVLRRLEAGRAATDAAGDGVAEELTR